MAFASTWSLSCSNDVHISHTNVLHTYNTTLPLTNTRLHIHTHTVTAHKYSWRSRWLAWNILYLGCRFYFYYFRFVFSLFSFFDFFPRFKLHSTRFLRLLRALVVLLRQCWLLALCVYTYVCAFIGMKYKYAENKKSNKKKENSEGQLESESLGGTWILHWRWIEIDSGVEECRLSTQVSPILFYSP